MRELLPTRSLCAFLVITFVVVGGEGLVGQTNACAAASSPPGTIGFVGRAKLGKGKGVFENWHFVSTHIDVDSPENSVVELEVDIASLKTDKPKRDDHLRERDFFFVERFPTASLRIYDFKKAGTPGKDRDSYTGTMDITIRGIKKTIPLSFEMTRSRPYQVQGSCEIARVDFKVGKPYKRFSLLSVKPTIAIDFSAIVPE